MDEARALAGRLRKAMVARGVTTLGELVDGALVLVEAKYLRKAADLLDRFAAPEVVRLTLADARHNGLIYWSPNTERGHVAKAQMLARIDTALSTLPPPASAARWKHVKRGTEYEVIGVGKMQTENWHTTSLEEYQLCGDVRWEREVDASADMREVVIYRCLADGSLWVRPREEFYDGRFVQVPPPAASGEG